MNTEYRIEHHGDTVLFICGSDEYELTSHPYEPCLYINQNGQMIHILHNAFDAYNLPDIFDAGNTVRGINGKEYDKEAFCKVLIATIKSGRYEMDWPFAAGLVKEG